MNAKRLGEYSVAKLQVELARRGEGTLDGERDGKPTTPCHCGSARNEIEDPENQYHYRRFGCLNCNTWDVSKRSVRK